MDDDDLSKLIFNEGSAQDSNHSEDPELLDDINNPEFIVDDVLLSNTGHVEDETEVLEEGDMFKFTNQIEDETSREDVEDVEKIMAYLNEYKEYMTYLRNEGVDVTHIPELTDRSDISQAKKAVYMARSTYDKISGGSLATDVIYASCNFVGDIFDGSTDVFGYKPNLKGWGDDVMYRLKSDWSLKRSVNKCGIHISNPYLNIAFKLLISGVTYANANSGDKKMRDNGMSSVRKAAMGLNDI